MSESLEFLGKALGMKKKSENFNFLISPNTPSRRDGLFFSGLNLTKNPSEKGS